MWIVLGYDSPDCLVFSDQCWEIHQVIGEGDTVVDGAAGPRTTIEIGSPPHCSASCSRAVSQNATVQGEYSSTARECDGDAVIVRDAEPAFPRRAARTRVPQPSTQLGLGTSRTIRVILQTHLAEQVSCAVARQDLLNGADLIARPVHLGD